METTCQVVPLPLREMICHACMTDMTQRKGRIPFNELRLVLHQDRESK
jgi:hypothetical protein